MRSRVFVLFLSLGVVGGLSCRGCGGSEVRVTGAGATFPLPLYTEWIASFERLHPEVKINYQSIGSGGGIRQLLAGTVDFGASDVPMDEAQLAKAKRPIVHLPTTVGAVVVAYNVPGSKPGLRLSQEVLAKIFLGEITRWNDPQITASNPTLRLPDKSIRVVHRSDGSGTTAAFTTFLTRVNAAWRERVGAGPSVSWPTGVGAKGNEGVTGQINSLPGSVGYVELAYALENHLPVAALENEASRYVTPSLESMGAALAGVSERLPEDLRLSLVESADPDAYPMTAFTFILVHRDGADSSKRRALAQFLWWAIHEGQAQSAKLHYASLPPAVVARIEDKLRSLKGAGKVPPPAVSVERP